MTPHVQTFFDKATSTATHLVSDPATRVAAVIDPVLDFEPKAARLSTGSADAVLAAVHEQGLTLAYVLETHAHADHLSAADYIRRETGAQVVIGAEITQVQKAFIPRFEADDVADDGRVFDRLLAEGDVLPLGSLDIGVLHTPGHTPACMTYLIGDAAFVGDTLFMPDYGTARCDFPGGDARALYHSIHAKLFTLPDATRVFMCHDYKAPGREEYLYETTIGAERAHNVHIHQGIGEEQFVAMRQARDATLGMPTLILPSVQINMRAGELPPAEANGSRYLKIPLDVL